MPDETPSGDGEIVEPITDYTPEEVEPEAPIVPSTPPSDDGSSIIGGPTYPAPGEG
jgi:hypothetical protein